MTLILLLKFQLSSVQNTKPSLTTSHRGRATLVSPSLGDCGNLEQRDTHLIPICAVKSHFKLPQKIPSSYHLNLLTFPLPWPMVLAQQLCDITSSAQNGSTLARWREGLRLILHSARVYFGVWVDKTGLTSQWIPRVFKLGGQRRPLTFEMFANPPSVMW